MNSEIDQLIARVSELDQALTHVSGLARLLAADRKKLEQARDEALQKKVADDTAVASKIAELESARQQAGLEHAKAASERAELKAKLARVDTALATLGA
jgi:hypothetical protein